MIYSAKKSIKVIFESNFTKELFIDNFGFDENKSEVIHIGKDNYFLQDNNYAVETSSNKYLLCVSHLYPYKNIENLLIAYARINKLKNKIPILKIAGDFRSPNYFDKLKNIIAANNLNDKVQFIGPVSKEELKYLYTNCYFMIFPSPFENFAYTLVEAMSCGAPIICSNTTAMPETCGDAAIYFDPYDVEEMEVKINLLLKDENLRNTLKEKSLARVNELPDYEEVILQIFDIMKNLVKEIKKGVN